MSAGRIHLTDLEYTEQSVHVVDLLDDEAGGNTAYVEVRLASAGDGNVGRYMLVLVAKGTQVGMPISTKTATELIADALRGPEQ